MTETGEQISLSWNWSLHWCGAEYHVNQLSLEEGCFANRTEFKLMKHHLLETRYYMVPQRLIILHPRKYGSVSHCFPNPEAELVVTIESIYKVLNHWDHIWKDVSHASNDQNIPTSCRYFIWFSDVKFVFCCEIHTLLHYLLGCVGQTVH